MDKRLMSGMIILLLSLSYVSAHGEEIFADAEQLIKSKTSCDELTEEQLEIIGDYYMEQMHPGELHETMDEMMGGEGSESLKQAHINIAETFYCGERGVISANMMNTFMGRGMMYSGRTGGWNMMNYMFPFGFGFGGMLFGALWMVLIWGLIIWLIIWLVKSYITSPKNEKKVSALDILKKRYAKGEITKKQFDKMKKGLR